MAALIIVFTITFSYVFIYETEIYHKDPIKSQIELSKNNENLLMFGVGLIIKSAVEMSRTALIINCFLYSILLVVVIDFIFGVGRRSPLFERILGDLR